MKHESCNECISQPVCEIYKGNIKHLKELNISFKVSTIADICPHYKNIARLKE